MHDLRQDVVYGLRMLRKHPGFTTIAAASLALGIGANAAVLGAFDALILQGLPVPHADRLVAIQSVPLDNPSQLGGNSLADYAAFRDRSQAFDAIDASIRVAERCRRRRSRHSARAHRRVSSSRRDGCRCSASQPLLGRVFTEAESQPYAPTAVIVISHALLAAPIRRRSGNPQPADPRAGRCENDHRRDARRASGTRNRTSITGCRSMSGPQPDAGARLFGVRARLKPA